MAAARATYQGLIARNRRNSVLLVAVFIIFVGVVVGVMSAAALGAPPEGALGTGAIAIVGASLVALWSYYGGSSAILGMSGAREIVKADDPQLFNVVEEMAIAAGIPVPKVYVMDDTALNAFATGRDPEHAAVAITSGLREKLSRAELQAVIAHEVSHVRHFDIRLMMLLATLVGMVVLLTDFFWRTLRFRMWTGGGRRGSRDGGAGAALMVVAVVLSIVAPFFARIIQLAASREREYLADAGAVELTRDADAMISALQKLGGDKEVLEAANRATAHLYIVQPIKKFEKRAQGLFATHPPLEARIERLRTLVPGPAASEEAA
ncbi:MAG: M48 family metalloprotease [Acidobacteria bacterium]|nr:M48 family metalloprotease [Acidobacteriota bacterium]